MPDIAENYLMVSLGKLAKMLPSDRARAELYKVAEALMQVAEGKGITSGILDGLAGIPSLRTDPAKAGINKSLSDAKEWTDYLVKEGAKYRQA